VGATVLVDGENVRRSLWPNLGRKELEGLAARWGEEHGHHVVVVWEEGESADDRIARDVRDLEPPVWVVTSDRGLRERIAEHTERLVGGGSFARELSGRR
jgi:predicted RNA-binding protein with PIN domain